MSDGPFPPHPSDPGAIARAAAGLTKVGSGFTALGQSAEAGGRRASAQTFGISEAVYSTIRPTTISTTVLQQTGAHAASGLRVWSSSVSTYNNVMRTLNRLWAEAKAADFGVAAADITPGMSAAEADTARGDRADAVAAAGSRVMAKLVEAKKRADQELEDAAQAVAAMLKAGPGASAPTVTLAGFGGGPGGPYPGLSPEGLEDHYGCGTDWMDPSCRAYNDHRSRVESHDGTGIPWIPILKFLLMDPDECTDDDASGWWCGVEVASIIPFGKWLKGTKVLKHLDRAREARKEVPKRPYDESRSRGSTGRKEPANLSEELAMEAVRANPKAGHRLNLKMNDPRWPASEGWVKMERKVNGHVVHYVMNERGDVDDFKFKTNPKGPLGRPR